MRLLGRKVEGIFVVEDLGRAAFARAGAHKVRYLATNNSGKYCPYHLRLDNTGHIISDRKILGFCLDKTGI